MGNVPGKPDVSRVYARFVQAAEAGPDRPAVIEASGATTTYGELAAAARQVGASLAAAGFRPGDRAAVVWTVGLPTVAAILGVLDAGGTYVPIDPDAPDGRWDFLLADAAPVAVLTSAPAHSARIRAIRPHAKSVSTVRDLELFTTDAAPADGDVDGCYLIYTSGSTGVPKGVVITHHNLQATLDAGCAVINAGVNDRWSVFHSFSFDFSVWELFGPLVTGGAAVLVPPSARRDPALFKELLDRTAVTVLSQTPGAFRGLVGHYADATAGSLRVVVFGGERLDPAVLAPWFARHGDETPELINMYGITECTIHVTYRRIRVGDAARPVSPIGRPFPHLTVHLLDPDGTAITAPGVVGELYVSGAGVASGYLNRAPETAAAFVPDTFPGGARRMYRTGDLARWDERGELLYEGRRDRQLKIRGHRIEPGEIQAALATLGYSDTLATVGTDEAGHARLVVYVVTEESGVERAILGQLRDTLPGYLVPSRIVLIRGLPLTPNGKIDEAALPEAFPAAAAPAEASPAGDPREALLRDVWTDVLGVDGIEGDDDFFDIGGDSLLAIRVVAAVTTGGYPMTVEDLYRGRTLTAVAAGLVAADPVAGAEAGPAPVTRLPATRTQQGILFEARVHRARALYHDFASLLVEARWDAARLRRALRTTTARQPTLRTAFESTATGMYQTVTPEVDVECTVVDLRTDDPRGADPLRRLWMDAERRRGFVMSRPPLFRAQAVVLSDDVFRLTLSFHHAVLDGWSVGLVAGELVRAYLDDTDPASHAPASPTLMSVYAEAEEAACRSDVTIAYWRDYLTGLTRADFARVPDVGAPGEVVIMPFATGDLAAIRAIARSSRTSVKNVLLTVHLVALAAVCSVGPAVSSAVVTSARPAIPGADTVAGLFLTTLPVTLRVASATWRDALRAVGDREVAHLPHRRFPAAEMARLAPDAVPNTLFNFTDFHHLSPRDGRRLPVLDYVETDLNNFDLSADYSAVGATLQLTARADLSRVPVRTSSAYVTAVRSALDRLTAGGGDLDSTVL
ncbi:amino acid adenylation domain-containing protein [Catenuloplanes atrovinosus]|uniref:Amino acid adenylation domain-containing protein n=1 Tax=Catenuloplanes atrovinosus TaxID=137266 RepID=A0AAE4CA90_9ACTN|nr:amino acid adenylation domain-containing protein [Catenuloplanes atrovinosus]MDR7275594.1 amino acid adenylation domain-containing protein [Catenuloplanes atrovinosus]